jgi:hypothetical protein
MNAKKSAKSTSSSRRGQKKGGARVLRTDAAKRRSKRKWAAKKRGARILRTD